MELKNKRNVCRNSKRFKDLRLFQEKESIYEVSLNKSDHSDSKKTWQ